MGAAELGLGLFSLIISLGGMIIWMLFMLVFFIGGIALTVFWIFMIIDAAQRKFKKDDEKVIWILILVFLGIIGAVIYYFVIKNKDPKTKKISKKKK